MVYQEAEKISMSEQPTSTDFETVRKIALSFPGVEEGTSFGTPAFRVRKKFLARLREDGAGRHARSGRRRGTAGAREDRCAAGGGSG